MPIVNFRGAGVVKSATAPCADFHASLHQNHSDSIHPQNKRGIHYLRHLEHIILTLLHIQEGALHYCIKTLHMT